MPLAIGTIVLLLVAFFSVLLGMLVAATIGIKRSDRGHYRALRNGRGNGTFSGAGRSVTGLCFVNDDATGRTGDTEGDDDGGDEQQEDGSAIGRTDTLV
ncbi:hypothetical protein GCM10027570_49420 [Streptomonospora sediminis]